MLFRTMRYALPFALLALALSGCGGGGANGPLLPDPKLRFVNGVPDSTALDWYIDNNLKATSITFASLTPTSTASAGDHDVSVQEHGSIVQLDAVAQKFNSNTNYLVAALGLENFGTEYDKRARDFFVGPNLTPPNGSKARLIILQGFNRAAGYATPQVDFKSPGDNPLIDVKNMNFGDGRSIDIDSGTTEFVVQRSGTSQVYIDQTFAFAAGKIYIALIDGVEGGAGNLTPQIQYIALN